MDVHATSAETSEAPVDVADAAMLHSVEGFYDALAANYHLIFEDWDAAMLRQASVLDVLLRERLGRERILLHDCACGIGTQAIGLTTLGYEVSGSDLSPGAVRRAELEAAKRKLNIPFAVSDMTRLAEYAPHCFDVVGAFDNALPHLSERELVAAARACKRVLREGGLFVASMRDYDELIGTRPKFQGPFFFEGHGPRRIVHQVWDWTGADSYDVHLYLTLATERRWEVLHFASRYRCLLRAEVTAALSAAGFAMVEWLTPEVTGYYQPVVVALAV